MLARIRHYQSPNEQGFTLIELLVVIIIIGILSAIAVPIFLNQRKKAADATVRSDTRTVADDEESFIVDNVFLQGYAFSAATNANAVFVGTAQTGAQFRPSPNNTVSTYLDSTGLGYCIVVVNPNSTKGTSAWYYDSAKGGPGQTACS